MGSSPGADNWEGYNEVLKNGNNGSLGRIRDSYELGKIAERNTLNLHLEQTLDRDRIYQVKPNPDGKLDEKRLNEEERKEKIIYAHPSMVPYQPGISASTSYSGMSSYDHSGTQIYDSAVLIVESTPPLRNVENLDDVRSFLIGDEKDQGLAGKHVNLQVSPFTV